MWDNSIIKPYRTYKSSHCLIAHVQPRVSEVYHHLLRRPSKNTCVPLIQQKRHPRVFGRDGHEQNAGSPSFPTSLVAFLNPSFSASFGCPQTTSPDRLEKLTQQSPTCAFASGTCRSGREALCGVGDKSFTKKTEECSLPGSVKCLPSSHVKTAVDPSPPPAFNLIFVSRT